MTPPLPSTGADLTFLYQVISGMDQKLDRLIETFVTVREYSQLENRVKDLETRPGPWHRNSGWLVALLGVLSSIAYLIVFLTK